VLVVDDDAGFRRVATRILHARGLEVVGEAGTCAAARELASALRPDAILLDVRLPDGNGIRLGPELAALPWHPRVVLVSSEPQMALEIAASAQLPFVSKAGLFEAPIAELLSGTAPEGSS
jgi:two-component system nitrate/nitrite response regulator NarL